MVFTANILEVTEEGRRLYLKHNTYSWIESFDGITSIGENLSKTEKYKGTILIRVFIWVTVLLRIFFQVKSINQNFCFEIFFGKANNVISTNKLP